MRPQCRVSRCLPVVFLWAVAAAPGPARADGLRRLDAAWLLPSRFEFGAVTGATAGPVAGSWARLGQARLHGLPELPARALAAGCAGGGGWAGEFSWDTLGAGGFRDDRVRMRAGVGRRLRWGLGARWRRLQAGSGAPGTRLDLGLEAGWCSRPSGLDGWVVEAHWPLLDGGDVWLEGEPEMRLRAAAGSRGRAVALDLDVAPSGEPAAGWEALCGLGAGCGLAWRVDGASGAVGGGLVYWRGLFRLRTSHLAHPALGLTHRLEVSFGRVAASPW